MAEKLAQLEPRSDGTALIRGRVGAILSQFEWAVLVPEGTVIPLVKTDVAVGSLEAAGWRVDRRRPEMVDKPKPNRDLSNLPECANSDCR